jgi:O-antigen/teichoic acid export membrane protein
MLLLAAMVPLAGLEGAAIARATITTLTFVLLAWTAWKSVHASIPIGALTRTIFAAAICAASAGVAVYYLDGLAAIAMAIPAGTIAYVLAVRILRLMEASDSQLLMDTIGGKLPGPTRPLVNGLLTFLAPG